MSRVLTEQRHAPRLLDWLAQRCGTEPLDATDARTIAFIDPRPDGIAREEDVLTVCALSRWTAHTCEATLATNGAKRPKASREYIWTIFDYVFNHAGKSRLYTFVAVDNHKSIAVQQLLGLKQEACLADHFGEGKDALLFGLTKSQWMVGPWANRDCSVSASETLNTNQSRSPING